MSKTDKDFSYSMVIILAVFLLGLVALTFVGTSDNTGSNPVTKLFIAGVIDDSLNPTVKSIRLTNRGDNVRLYLSSMGGTPTTGFDLINAMNESKAHITLVVDNYAFSMAAIMVCGKDKDLELSDDAILLFHTMQGLAGPVTLKDLPKEQPHNVAIFFKVMTYMTIHCNKAFTKEDWNAMWNDGKDIVMTGKEYKHRMGIK